MPRNLDARHIASQDGGYEPQRTNQWSIRISAIGQNGGVNRSSSDVIEASLHNFTPPKQNITELAIPYGNSEVKVAGRVEMENMTLVLKDFVDVGTWQVFWDWQQLVYNHQTGGIGYASAYKREGLIYLYAPDGTKERRFRAVGIWPSQITPSDFDMTGAEQNLLTVNMVTDAIRAEQLVAA